VVLGRAVEARVLGLLEEGQGLVGPAQPEENPGARKPKGEGLFWPPLVEEVFRQEGARLLGEALQGLLQVGLARAGSTVSRKRRTRPR
jgi:hypothetical protein